MCTKILLLLLNLCVDKVRYSPAMDVYAFGIVMWELVTGEIPYSDEEWDWRVRETVAGGGRPRWPTAGTQGGATREGQSSYQTYVNLAGMCWAHDPHERPSIDVVVGRLNAISM